jgi:YXWGXW repeat-containing protein
MAGGQFHPQEEFLAMISNETRQYSTTRSRTVRFAILALLAFGGGAAWPLCAAAQVSVDIIIGSPPPPVRVEAVPVPRPGYVWAPGYWAWDGHRHTWFAGHWEAERANEHYVAAGWVNTPGGWRFVPAHWERSDRGRDAFCPPGQAKKGRC